MTAHRPGGHTRGGHPRSSGAPDSGSRTLVAERPPAVVVRVRPDGVDKPGRPGKPTKRRGGTRRRRHPAVALIQRHRKLTAWLAVLTVAGVTIAVTGLVTTGALTGTRTTAGSDADAQLIGGRATGGSATKAPDAEAGRLGATTGKDGDLLDNLPAGIGAAAGQAGATKSPSTGAGAKTKPVNPVAPPAGARPPAGSVNTAGALSGLPWLSGAWVSTDVTTTPAFGTWRGRPLDLIQAYTPRDGGWNGMVNPGWPVDTVKGFPGRLVLSVPTFPEGGGSNAQCATGAYDGYWKQLGSFLVAHGRANTIIRLGWEFNGEWMYWHADATGADFKACYQHAAVALRAGDPQVLMDWTFTAHNTQDPKSNNPYDAYPGDAYVDFIGIDAYDSWPASTNQATWDAQCGTVNGLCYAMNFARAHHKKVGVGEWGVVACGTGGTAPDNPFYVQKMYETFKANADVMGYEAYFNDPDAGNVCSAIENGQQNPKAAAEYKRLFGR